MDPVQTVEQLKQKIAKAALPSDVEERLVVEVSRVSFLLQAPNLFLEADKQIAYINFICELPWNSVPATPLNLSEIKKLLDQEHFGLEDIKRHLLEYFSMIILNDQNKHRQSTTPLLFTGLVGSGKTSLAYSIATALHRPIARIPFGGLGSAVQLRGQSRVVNDAQPGLIMRALKKTGVKNPVILLDEIDRVATEARNDIMGVLVELLDPEQNMAFLDHYVDIPFDVSQVLFIATSNNTNNIATAVMDRLEVIEMPFYSDEQKIVIGKDYLLPHALEKAGLQPGAVVIDPALWGEIVRPLGFDGGIRSLKRTIDGITRKAAMQVVEGKGTTFQITAQNLAQYLNK